MKRTKRKSFMVAPIIIVAVLIALMLGLRFFFFKETFTPLKVRQQTAIEASTQTINSFFDAVLSGDTAYAEELSENLSFDEGAYSGDVMELAKSCFDSTVLSSKVNKDGSVENTVRIKWLNVSEMLSGMNEEIQSIAGEKLEAAKDSTEVYDTELKYRQDVIDNIFEAVLAQRMENCSEYMKESTVVIKTGGDANEKVIVTDELFNILANGRGNN